MLDRTIPFCNTIMKCSDYSHRNVELPDGFSIVPYQHEHEYEKEWAKLEYAIGDFDSVTKAEKYFIETYLQKPEIFPNILFMLNKDHDVAGSCIAWQDMQGTNSACDCSHEHLCRTQGFSCLYPYTTMELESNLSISVPGV